MKFSDWDENDLYYCALPVICYFLKLLKETLPEAQIYCLINTEIKSEIVYCMEKACKIYNIVHISFDSIDKIDGHPTVLGMKEISSKIIESIKI